MKRENKFRGKIAREDLEDLISCELEIPHKDGWVVGSFVEPNIITGRVADIDWDYFATEWWAKVIPESVGEFTGLKDKNGKEIYEGDVIAHKLFPDDVEIVKYKDGAFRVGKFLLSTFHCSIIKRVGNIHDNPELLK